MTGPDALAPAVSSESIFDGEIVSLRVSHYQRPHGALVRREVVEHPGGVTILAVRDGCLGFVRQPREAIGRMLLELPAGKLDVDGEPPLECAKRELGEEMGVRAEVWVDLGTIVTSPAISTEIIHIFLATEITAVSVEAGAEEEIERIWWPMNRLGEIVGETLSDAKSLAGLMRLAAHLGALAPEGPLKGLW